VGLDLYIYTQSKPGAKLGEQLPREEVAYFRKFNALLKWVDTHVKKVENLKDVILGKDDLQNLLNTLDALNEKNSHELFPTAQGFFFGSLEYDEWYWQDVGELKTIIQKLLEEVDFERMVVYFHVWW